MLAAAALANKTDLAAAQSALSGVRAQAAARVLDVIFQMRGIAVNGAVVDSRLRDTLRDLWGTAAVCQQIALLEQVLWAEPGEGFAAWVRQRYAATLAQALRSAMVSLVPQVNEDELSVDVLPRPDAGFDLIIAESSPGGIGQIETIVRELQRQPRRFLDGIEFALSCCERERSSSELLSAVQKAVRDPQGGLAGAFAEVRAASGFSEMEASKLQLQEELQLNGFSASRSLVVSVVNKLLRPGSSPQSDRLMFRLNRAWRRRSDKLGIAVPVRTFAYTCARHDRIGPFLSDFFEGIGGERPSEPQLFAQLQQFLFETCEDSCPECLHQRGRFYDLGFPSRALARAWLGIEIPAIDLAGAGEHWLEQARQILRASGRVRLVAAAPQRAALAEGLPQLCVQELDLESLRVPVSVAKIETAADRIAVVLHIQDFING
jgi:hypothetical protein